MRTSAVMLGCTVALLAGSCGSEDKSGACTGTMNGAYFRLEFGNYLTSTAVDVRINGRFIGNVGKGTVIPQSNPEQIEAKVKRMGEFPVCDKLVIDAEGEDGSYSNRLCAKPAYLSPSCSGGVVDFCYETIILLPDNDCLNNGRCIPFTPGSPPCPCTTGFEPGAAWEPC